MKKLHPFISIPAALLILLLTPSLLSQNCSYSWSAQSSGTTQLLYTVKAVSGLICWAGGANATVRRTTDGGSTWVNGNPNPGVITGQVNYIDAIDADNAWLTSTSGGSTFIYRTTSGGNSWQQVFLSSQTVIFGIKMHDATSGFAFGDPISNVWQLLVTTNGGLTWQLSPNAPTAASNIETCLPRSFQVDMPNIWWGTSITTVYRSTDGGVSFSSHAANVSGIYILAVHYNSAGVGLSSSVSMSRSTNSGASYTSLPAPGAGNISGIQGEGENFWFIRGTGVYRSTNSGNSWEQVYNTASTLQHIDFPDNLTGCQTGWAVGNGGNIHKMSGSITSAGNNNNSIPTQYELKQNYPNPFNPTTNFGFRIAHSGFVTLNIIDISGKEVAVLVNEKLNEGVYNLEFDASYLASGVYFYTLRVSGFTQTRKMLMIK
jgi:photosystem II stability/assembly factor-like uncharacterized protein